MRRVVITLRLATREEQYGVRCGARRAARGTIVCEMPALHAFGCTKWVAHSGRGRDGRWFFWERQEQR